MSEPKRNLPASVLDRLRNKAREGQKPSDQVLRYYGFERFLYRLSRSAHRDQFVLKGALLMTAWPMGLTRSTSDIDFRAFTDSSPVALSRIIGEILQVAVEPDAMEFDPSTIQAAQMVEREGNPGVRVRFWGSLGKARVRLQLDVAFADVITPGPEEVDYPTILDLPGPRLRAYPKETVVAEKLEAIVRLGGVNSRMKDFFDLWQVSVAFPFDGESLKDAIANTFGSRRTPISTLPPVGLSHEFATRNQRQWEAFLKRIGNDEDQLSSLEAVIFRLRGFALPPMQAARDGVKFNQTWTDPEGWR